MRASFFVRFMIPSMVLGLAACGGGTTESSGAGGGAGATGTTPIGGGVGGSTTSNGGSTAPSTSAPYGYFEIDYDPGTGTTPPFTSITGFMRDGTPTEATLWEKKKTEGDCSLFTPRAPFCESCVSPQVCVADNVCRTPPSTYSVGNVTLTGLNPPDGANPLPLMLVSAGLTSYQCVQTMPMPPCAAGGPVRLDAAGEGQFPAFSINSQCIAPLVVSNPKIAIESGKDFTLTWSPGSVADARIGLTFDLSHHGGSKGRLICDTADSGSLKVSGALIKSLMDLGVTGYPSADVRRVLTSKSTVGTGQAELRFRSNLSFVVEIPGLKSCDSNTDCTAPETCQIAGRMCGIACTTNADCPSGKTCFSATKVCK